MASRIRIMRCSANSAMSALCLFQLGNPPSIWCVRVVGARLEDNFSDEMVATGTAQRIVVAGYGDSRPLPGLNPTDARNRRVEVQLALE